MRTGVCIYFAGLLCAVGACNSEQPALPAQQAASEVTTVFDCETGDEEFAFTVRTIGHGLALWLPQEFNRPYVALEPTPAASGAKYERDAVVVWMHGDEAMLGIDGELFRGCRRNAHASIWEHAKLGGVDFRAIGNEPGWILEIRERTSIDLSYDYGESRIRATSREPVNDQQSMRTTYEAEADGQRLTLEIVARACNDSMSGEQFESTVILKLGAREMKGCGRSLH